jgi:hypothetical protein
MQKEHETGAPGRHTQLRNERQRILGSNKEASAYSAKPHAARNARHRMQGTNTYP